MPKKKAVRKTTRRTTQAPVEPEPTELEAARERLRAARQELRSARRAYLEARFATQGNSDENDIDDDETTSLPWEDCSVSELVDDSLRCVRRYPALGVLSAAFGGLLLGKIFRR